MQVYYGILIACGTMYNFPSDFCVVRTLEPVMSPNNEPILNEVECPLLALTHQLIVIKPSQIVSIVHRCSNSCSVQEETTTM